MKTRVKICGITRPADARFAVDRGADLVGVIFAASPRRVTAARAREIRDAVPDAVLVGVFVDAPLGRVADTAEACGLDYIQLHGAESPGYCDALRERSGVPVIKAFRAGDIPDTATLSRYATTSYFLFDLDGRTNGSMPELWTLAAERRRAGFRILIAGALTDLNVRDAMAATRAWGVDVCRGVERSPGVKDPDAVARFISAVRQ